MKKKVSISLPCTRCLNNLGMICKAFDNDPIKRAYKKCLTEKFEQKFISDIKSQTAVKNQEEERNV